ncbi:MAG: hypothetical protein Alpg2KO_26630 [Alphaproteobacteria bacterium]
MPGDGLTLRPTNLPMPEADHGKKTDMTPERYCALGPDQTHDRAYYSLDMVWETEPHHVEPVIKSMCAPDALIAVITPIDHQDSAIGAQKLKRLEGATDDLLARFTVMTSTREEFIANTQEQRAALKQTEISSQQVTITPDGHAQLQFDWLFEAHSGEQSVGSHGKCLSIPGPDGRFIECWNCLVDIDFDTLSQIRAHWHRLATDDKS